MHIPLPCPEMPDRCELQHQVFTSFGDVRFRRSTTDGVAMMALRLGEREAQLPLDALRREFSIGRETADGRMLDLIGSALDYVAFLQPGDRLPAEIRTGEASWKPSPSHLRLATTRLQLDFCAWIYPGGHWAQANRDELSLLRLADDAALQEDVASAARQASEMLDLADGATVSARLAELSRELAYIEALRERLLERVIGLCRRTGGMLRDGKRPAITSDTLSQVHRLMVVATKQIVQRFEELDAQTCEIADLLRDIEGQRSFIRSNRDWLYRNQRAWEAILGEWQRCEDGGDTGPLLGETYHFLAQRFMPTTAWHRGRPDRRRSPAPAQMAW